MPEATIIFIFICGFFIGFRPSRRCFDFQNKSKSSDTVGDDNDETEENEVGENGIYS